MKACIVGGGSGKIASYMVPMLIERGWHTHLLSRRAPKVDYGQAATWHAVDFTSTEPLPKIEAEALFFTPRLAMLAPRIDEFAVKRMVAFSTVSVFTRTLDSDPTFGNALAKAETDFIEACRARHIRWTILRPTQLYGTKTGDVTIEIVAKIRRRARCFPVWRGAPGLRQPVHIEDLARAAVDACEAPAAFDRAFNLGGGEALSYRKMIERIILAMGRKPRIVPAPRVAFKIAALIMRRDPRFRDFSMDYAERMQIDTAFGYEEAAEAFGYSPREFRPVVHT